MFNALEFCKDYNIPYRTEGKNTQDGWVQICCPNCSDFGFHGGINIEKGYFNCWKCGHDYLDRMIMSILGLKRNDARDIIRIYSNKGKIVTQKRKANASSVSLPIGTTDMTKKHRQYLRSRGFNSKRLEKTFNLKGTGHRGPYKFRIIAPIYLNGQLISYQGRDITGKQELRYKACAKEKEVRDHKTSLYAVDLVPGNRVVAVEGIADVWKLGPGSAGLFGTSYTQAQVYLLNSFDFIFILFDNDDEAQERAEKLAWSLSALGSKSEIITGLDTDPGDLSPEDAKYIMRELL